ncbi:MAG: ATP-binding protein [Pseudomonadota bacterium]
MGQKANVLGDVRAEADTRMLNVAFYETADYKTLLESADRTVAVGRRGTGKSALAYMLERHWRKADRTAVIHLAADEDQIIGIRSLIKLFGEDFRLVRAGSRVAWRYAFLMETADTLSAKYKYKKSECAEYLETHLSKWRANRYGFCGRLKDRLRSVIDSTADAETRVSDLAQNLNIKDVEDAVEAALEATKMSVSIVVDRLDEGYEPDATGIGLVDGLVHAVIDLNTKFSVIRTIIFLRDNIFRAVTKHDPDFSRNIEGQVLRLHWDEYGLFNLVTNRLKAAFSIDQENTTRIWNHCTARDLQGNNGFRKCLRLTLYRPRDLLILLNDAFLNAAKRERTQIVDVDIELTAKTISRNRLDDLEKEYSAIFPGLSLFTATFSNKNPEMSVAEAANTVSSVLSQDSYDPKIQQQVAIFQTPIDVMRDLYRVGFLGVLDDASSNYIFCHDGRDPNKEFEETGKILVHPCYWMALNSTRNTLDPEEAEEIYDEYDIEVASETPEQRAKRIGQVIAQLNEMPEGQDGFKEFEDWCLQAVRIVFAGALRNSELHPNKIATQRRDIVATNLGETPVWRRVYEDYGVRQVIFEVKNYKGIGDDEYRQMLSYLTGEYGKLGFIINRDNDTNLEKGRELDWMREMYNYHNVLIVKLTGKYLTKLLSKLRNPQKHDVPDRSLNGLLDTYTRLYISGGVRASKKGKKR